MNAAIDWRTTFEAFPALALLVDEHKQITWMNPVACRALRLSIEEAQGRMAGEVICGVGEPAGSLEAAPGQITAPMREIIEAPRIEKTLDVMTCPLHDDQGQVIGALHIAHDVTGARAGDDGSPDSDERYRELVGAIQEGLGIVDEKEVIQYCNPAFARIFELPAAALVGKSLRDFVDEDSWQRILDETAIRRAGKDSVYEVTIRTGRGNRRHITVHASSRVSAAGEYVGTFGLVQDTTERKQAERERERLLHELEQRVKELSCIYSISRAIETYDSVPGLMKEITRLIVPGTGAPDETYAAILLDGEAYETNPEKRQAGYLLEVPITIGGKSRGQVVISRRRAYPFSPEEQKLLTRIAESVQRVVLRKELQNQLFFAQKMESIGTLAGGIAHDFNNLMVGVLGSVSLLRDRLGPQHDAAAYLTTIEESATRAGVLARQLLTYARGGESQPQILNLNNAVEKLLNEQDGFLSAKVRVDFDLDPDLAEIKADPAQIRQLLVDLCTNAAEAMQSGGRIRLTTRNTEVDSALARSRTGLTPGLYVSLTVEDEGGGMDARTQTRMFDPFFSTKFQGRGLGLAVVYGIVKNHKGYISAESQVGKGTVIAVLLPAVRRLARLTPETAVPAHHGSETVLLIDDEAMVIDITRQLLEKLGYRVLTANDGREAVQVAETYQGSIDLALLDLGMPVMDGYQAFPLLQKHRPDMKILVCTGYAANGPAEDLIRAGAVNFIQKPFGLDTLSEAIRMALDGKSPVS